MTPPIATPSPGAAFQQFNWQPQPAAQKLVNDLVADFHARCPRAAALAEKMKSQTGTRFIDWIDHIEVPRTDALVARLAETRFERKSQWSIDGQFECFANDGGMFPHILVSRGSMFRIGLKVEYVADFLGAWQLGTGSDVKLEGEPFGQYRRALAFIGNGAELWVIERHGYRGYALPRSDAGKAILAQKHLESFRARKRDWETDEQGLEYTHALVDAAVRDLGKDWACDVFFAGERDYWQRRNRAARVQKARQDTLGLGWANHDHHTYRCSRRHFSKLVSLWEKMGLVCRERFYAGAEAGWGAQVLEQPITGIITFNDVDLSPDELLGDFAHEPMSERGELGTVGLWCALHGEAVLQAGMHHLEAMFDWHALKDQLQAEGKIRTMDPFTTFPYLRQAFTEGERWSVAEKRIDAMLSNGKITREQADQFRTFGAIGSHLENLERNDGFKGFNQQGVSDIIAKTDPRRLVQAVAAAQ
jgi:hypothetical protein